MALFGSLTTFAMNALLGKLLGGTDFTPPDPIYFAWHVATVLTADCTTGNGTISTNDPVAAGSNLIVAPLYSGATDMNAEQHVVSNLTGLGPYTLTLGSNLTNNHLAGAYVAFDPGPNCEQLLEPIGNGYSRTSRVNNTTLYPTPSGGEVDSGTEIASPSPTGLWGLATHLVGLDDATVGAAWFYGVLQSFALITPTVIAVPRIAAGNFIVRASKPTS